MRVIILQGVPGSGKSTFVKSIKPKTGVVVTPKVTVVSADHYFEDGQGNYNFDPTKLGEAHAQCMSKFLNALLSPNTMDDVIIVDNTNITTDQMSPYYLVARSFKGKPWYANLEIEIVRVECDPELAASRNSHGVPRETVLRMHRMMQDPPRFWDAIYKKV